MNFKINIVMSNNKMVNSEDFTKDVSYNISQFKVVKNSFMDNNIPIYTQYQMTLNIPNSIFKFLYSYMSIFEITINVDTTQGTKSLIKTYIVPTKINNPIYNDISQDYTVDLLGVGVINWRLSNETLFEDIFMESQNGAAYGMVMESPWKKFTDQLIDQGFKGYYDRNPFVQIMVDKKAQNDQKTSLATKVVDDDHDFNNIDIIYRFFKTMHPILGVPLFMLDDFFINIPENQAGTGKFFRIFADELITSTINKESRSSPDLAFDRGNNFSYMKTFQEVNLFEYIRFSKSTKEIHTMDGMRIHNPSQVFTYQFDGQLLYLQSKNPYSDHLDYEIDEVSITNHEYLISKMKEVSFEVFGKSPYMLHELEVGKYFSIVQDDGSSKYFYIYGQEIEFYLNKGYKTGENINATTFSTKVILKTIDMTRLITQNIGIVLENTNINYSTDNPTQILLNYLGEWEGTYNHVDQFGHSTSAYGINADANPILYKQMIEAKTDDERRAIVARYLDERVRPVLEKQPGFSNLTPEEQMVVMSRYYNTGSVYSKLISAMNDYNNNPTEANKAAIIREARTMSGGVPSEGLDNRVAKELIAAGIVANAAEAERYGLELVSLPASYPVA